MTAMWFGLAAIALAGAVALLYIDRSRRDQLGRVRQMWAKAQGYSYSASDEDIVLQFGRAALAKPEQTTAVDLVRGVRRGEKFVLFDVEETSTIVAVQRPVGSDVDIDLRLKSTPPPRDADMELLGSIGPRVVFATDVEIARRVVDQRMAAFTESIPSNLSLIWSENDWTLGSLPLGSSGRDWDAAIDAVARLSGMLHVLPPVTRRSPDPRRAGESDRRRRAEIPAARSIADEPPRREAQRFGPAEAPSRRDSAQRDSGPLDSAQRDSVRREMPRPDPRGGEPRPPLRPAPNRPMPGSRPGPGTGPRPAPPARVEQPNRPTPITRDRPAES